jgi:hypothetical protein
MMMMWMWNADDCDCIVPFHSDAVERRDGLVSCKVDNQQQQQQQPVELPAASFDA